MLNVERAKDLVEKTGNAQEFDFSKKIGESLCDYNKRIKDALENKVGIFVFPEFVHNNKNKKTGKKNFENWEIRPYFSVIENMEDIIGTDIFKEKDGELSIRRNSKVHYFGIKDEKIIHLISKKYSSNPQEYGEHTRFYIDPQYFYVGNSKLLKSLSPEVLSLQGTQA